MSYLYVTHSGDFVPCSLISLSPPPNLPWPVSFWYINFGFVVWPIPFNQDRLWYCWIGTICWILGGSPVGTLLKVMTPPLFLESFPESLFHPFLAADADAAWSACADPIQSSIVVESMCLQWLAWSRRWHFAVLPILQLLQSWCPLCWNSAWVLFREDNSAIT